MPKYSQMLFITFEADDEEAAHLFTVDAYNRLVDTEKSIGCEFAPLCTCSDCFSEEEVQPSGKN